MEDANTGEAPSCTICGAPYGGEDPCDHVVACIDRTFREYEDGAIYEREREFSDIIQNYFWKALNAGIDVSWRNAEIQTAWSEAKSEYNQADGMTEEELMVDPYAFCRFMVEYLETCGAKSCPGAWVFYGPPGMSSAYALLFAERPKELIDHALESLSILLEIDYNAGIAKLSDVEKKQAKKGSVIREELSLMTELEAAEQVRELAPTQVAKPITPREYAEHLLGRPLTEEELLPTTMSTGGAVPPSKKTPPGSDK